MSEMEFQSVPDDTDDDGPRSYAAIVPFDNPDKGVVVRDVYVDLQPISNVPGVFAVPLDSIVIGDHVRSTSEGIPELAANIQEFGLLQPVTISRQYRLIHGYRRLEAHKLAGLPTINAMAVSEIRHIFALIKIDFAMHAKRKAPSQADRVLVTQKLLRFVADMDRRKEQKK